MDLFDSGSFDSDLFGDEEEEIRDRKATKEEKQALLSFIGGFSYWPMLNSDSKIYIIGLLDYWTRCNLSLCSKIDNQLVKEAILFKNEGKGGGIRLKHRNLNVEEQGTVIKIVMRRYFFELHTSTGFSRSWKLKQHGTDIFVHTKSSLKNQFTYSSNYTIQNGNIDEEFLKIVNKWIKSTLETVVMEIDWDPINQILCPLPNLKTIKLSQAFPESVKFWVDKLGPNHPPLDKFSLNNWLPFTDWPQPFQFDMIDHPAILNAKEFIVSSNMDITDEQFLRIQSPKIKIISSRTLGLEAIYEHIRRWVETDFEITKCIIWHRSNHKMDFFDRLLRDFNTTVHDFTAMDIPNWRDFFSKFCNYFNYGKIYQVRKRDDIYSSISVLVSFDIVVIVRTGFPEEVYGGKVMKLRFPEGNLMGFD